MKYELVTISVLYDEGTWDLLVSPEGANHIIPNYNFMSGAVVDMEDIIILLR